jgi:hypothetical protein
MQDLLEQAKLHDPVDIEEQLTSQFLRPFTETHTSKYISAEWNFTPALPMNNLRSNTYTTSDRGCDSPPLHYGKPGQFAISSPISLESVRREGSPVPSLLSETHVPFRYDIEDEEGPSREAYDR